MILFTPSVIKSVRWPQLTLTQRVAIASWLKVDGSSQLRFLPGALGQEANTILGLDVAGTTVAAALEFVGSVTAALTIGDLAIAVLAIGTTAYALHNLSHCALVSF